VNECLLCLDFEFIEITAMSETRRHLANINDSLRAEHGNLKATKDHLLEHISGLRARDQQLQSLKNQLSN
jgi:hypothetical protein